MTTDRKTFGEVFDAHTFAEFQARDIEATMATMGGAPHVTHVPTMTGGSGLDGVRKFYETWFIGKWPADTVVTSLTRTIGEAGLVDELIISSTHDCEMPALLPGVAPTGRKVTIPFVVAVGFDGDKISYERIYWDQASMLVQLGLLDKAALPVTVGIQEPWRSERSTSMPIKKRTAKAKQSRITQEAVEAFISEDCCRLHKALDLRPWQVSPLDADDGPSPWPRGNAGDLSWPNAQELRRLLEEAASK